MKKSDLTYILCVIYTSLVAFFYYCTIWFKIKLPRYYPLEHTWKWVKEKGVPSQGWYGMQAFAFLAAGVVTLIAYFVLKATLRKKENLNPVLAKSIGMISIFIILVCLGLILHHEFDKWCVFTAVAKGCSCPPWTINTL